MAELISSSQKELKAALKETEKAANKIMSAAEDIQKITANLTDKKSADKITKALTYIFESSNFQDLTGQRISKVIENLAEIKEKKGTVQGDKKSAEKELMQGPKLKAARQKDIDKLFDSF